MPTVQGERPTPIAAQQQEEIMSGYEAGLEEDQQAEQATVETEFVELPAADRAPNPAAETGVTDRDLDDLNAMQAAPEPEVTDSPDRPGVAVATEATSGQGMIENRTMDANNARKRLDEIEASDPENLATASVRAVDSLRAAGTEDADVRRATRTAQLQEMADNGALVAGSKQLDEHEARLKHEVPLPPKQSLLSKGVDFAKNHIPFLKKPTDANTGGGEA
jgi:hypothetical protein